MQVPPSGFSPCCAPSPARKNDSTRSLSFPKSPSRLRAVSDSENDPLSSLLSSFALGPSWARATGAPQERTSKPSNKSEDRPPRRDGERDRNADRSRDREPGRDRDSDRGRDAGRRPFQDRRGKFDARQAPPARPEEAPPAEGVRVTLVPDPQAVHLIGKEVQHVARVYPLYDVAKILLAERARCRAHFESPEPNPPLLRGKLDESVFLTREEAQQHLWKSDLRQQFIEEETIEVDPPTGNFQSVARCGVSGEWLGPPNFHSYQINLRRLHRERFSHLPFTVYSARVRTERGEEAVNAWLETTKQKTHWRIKGDADEAWIEDRAEAERALAARCFDQAFAEVRATEVLASIAPSHISPSLLTSLQIAGNHARNHPAILIPAVCRAAEAEHLPVFKRQGKLLTGPARPHPLPPGAVLAERPGIMVEWIRANKPAKLEGLWKAVLPEGGTAPPAEFAADLFWLLHQGHILLFTDDTLHVQELRTDPSPDSNATPKSEKSKKKRAKKTTAAREPQTEMPDPEASDSDTPLEIEPIEPTASNEIEPIEPGPSVDIAPIEPEAPVAIEPIEPGPSAEISPIEIAPADPLPPIEIVAIEPMPPVGMVAIEPMPPIGIVSIDPMPLAGVQNTELSKNPSVGVDVAPGL